MVAVEADFQKILADIRSFSTRYNPNTEDENYFVAKDLWKEFQQFKTETGKRLASAGISPGITKSYLGVKLYKIMISGYWKCYLVVLEQI